MCLSVMVMLECPRFHARPSAYSHADSTELSEPDRGQSGMGREQSSKGCHVTMLPRATLGVKQIISRL